MLLYARWDNCNYTFQHISVFSLLVRLFFCLRITMPYNLQQHKLFEAAAHSAEIAKRTGIPMETAAKMAHEGVKKEPKSKKLAKALMK